MNIAYYNNEFCVDRNVISIYNGSFLYGINIFEGIRAYWNSDKEKINIFGLDEHLERLYVSGNFVGFSMPITKERLKNELYNIFETHSICENVYIRITFFIAGETSWAESDKIDYIISVRSMTSNIIENNSMKLSISNFNRISSRALPPSVKAGANYLNSRYAHLQAKRNGYDGALLINDKGFVSESTGACVFFIKDNTLYTPSVNNDILVGVSGDYEVINDRHLAIAKGMSLLKENDILMILGKGHEDYQIIGTEKIHFSDQEEVEKYIREHIHD